MNTTTYIPAQLLQYATAWRGGGGGREGGRGSGGGGRADVFQKGETTLASVVPTLV